MFAGLQRENTNQGESFPHPLRNIWHSRGCKVLHKHSLLLFNQLHTDEGQELAIVVSLASIALDLVHCHLLKNGINLRLLTSTLRMTTPGWLFSLISVNRLRLAMSRRGIHSTSSESPAVPLGLRSKTFLYVTLIDCKVLATQVGPAFAMLFTPV
jgi:hypothetical protein